MQKICINRGYGYNEYRITGEEVKKMSDNELVKFCDEGYNYGHDVTRTTTGATVKIYID